MHVALIDTGHANLRSVARALERAGERMQLVVERTHAPEVIRRADKVVVPGQGGFGDCLRALRAEGADQALLEHIASGKPYLGICLGLQALFEGSAESPDTPGLGVLAGQCEQLALAPGIKIPHMGWNELQFPDEVHPVLQEAGGVGSWFYFVHSYHARPRDPGLVQAFAGHGPHRVTAAIAKDNVLATQFHPEKSQAAGLSLLRAFLAWPA
jgi:glutamine amidotransferase